MPADFPTDNPYDLERCMHRLTYPSPSSHRSDTWCRNIDLLSIDYAFRPRLRNRLTLRRLTWRRKPWVLANGFFTRFNVTHVSIRTSHTSSMPHSTPSQA